MLKLTKQELFKLKRAMRYCRAGHDAINQKRKYTGEPYWVHPIEVMGLVWKLNPDAKLEDLFGALFHDLVEDTQITLFQIQEDWGDEVAEIVSDLTDVSKPEDGNRRTRKTMDLEHTAKSMIRSKNIKLCDLISNTKSIVKHDKEFARVYLVEKEKMLFKALKEANQDIWNIAYKLLQESQAELIRASLEK